VVNFFSKLSKTAKPLVDISFLDIRTDLFFQSQAPRPKEGGVRVKSAPNPTLHENYPWTGGDVVAKYHQYRCILQLCSPQYHRGKGVMRVTSGPS